MAQLEGILAMVQQLLSYPHVDERGALAAVFSGTPKNKAKMGADKAAHHEPDLLINTLTVLMRPAVFFKQGKNCANVMDKNIISYAFVLAIVRRSFELFFEELEANNEKTVEHAQMVTAAISGIFDLASTAADIAPGGATAAKALKIPVNLAEVFFDKVKGVTSSRAGKNNPDKTKIINALKDKFEQAYEKHITMANSQPDHILGLMVKASASSDSNSGGTIYDNPEEEVKEGYAKALRIQAGRMYSRLGGKLVKDESKISS